MLNPGGMLEQLSGAMNEGLSDALFGGHLDKLMAEKPEEVKEILVSWETETRNFIDKNGQINRDALRKQLTLGEKFGLMAKLWIAENVSDGFLDGAMKGKKVETSDFAADVARVKADGNAMLLDDKNVFLPTADGFLGTLTTLMNLKGNVAADASIIKLSTGSTLVLPKGADSSEGIMGIDVSAALRIGLLKHGIDLRSFSINENIPDPGEKEIQLITVPEEGLPMKGGNVDIEALKAYARLFERGKVQWFTNPLLMAAVLVVKENDAAKIDAIMKQFGLPEESKAQFSALISPAAATA